MLKRFILCLLAFALLAVPTAAIAHVTIQPGEWEAGAFARMVIRVPNERDDAETVSVTVQFPENVPTARFQTHPFCEREVERDEAAERIVSVTWTCDPAIPVDGFDEFGVSFRVPEDAAPGDEILFPATQTYSSGEEVSWIDPGRDADAPAPRIVVTGGEEEEPAEEETAAEETAAEEEAAAPVVTSSDDDRNLEIAAIVFGLVGLAAGLAALGVALFRKPTT